MSKGKGSGDSGKKPKKDEGRNSERGNGKAFKKRPKKQDVNLNPSPAILAKREARKRHAAIRGLHEADRVDNEMRQGR
jgi:hypothetical protein